MWASVILTTGLFWGGYMLLKGNIDKTVINTVQGKQFISPAIAENLINNNKIDLLKSGMITENFSWGEAFIHASEADIRTATPEILRNIRIQADAMESIRKFFGGFPVFITSWYRSSEHNARVGGARHSYHLQGLATDFIVSGLLPAYVQKKLDNLWLGGLGYGATFTHIDSRGYRARFNY